MGKMTVLCMVLTAALVGEAAAATPCGSNSYLVWASPGPEDFELQQDGPRGPRLILSADDRREHGGGRIVFLDLQGPRQDIAEEATIVGRDSLPPLHPVGISLVGSMLYVIHADDRQRWIERFHVEAMTLRAAGPPLQSPFVTTPNDLIALPNGEIYLSNTGYGRNKIRDFFATLVHAKRGSVAHYDGKQWKTFAPRIYFPNGLAVDRDQLFVSVFGAKELRIHSRTSGRLLKTVELDAHPDNLMWEVPGRVLDIAAHRSPTKTALHVFSKRFSSPSIGYAYDVAAGRVDTIYDRPEFNASSTALAVRDRIYVSQLADPYVAVLEDCRP
jgi:Strictosidine synthase